MSAREYLDASPSSRRNFLLLVMALGGVGFALAYFVEPALYVHLKLLLPCEQVQWLRGLLLGAALITLLLAIALLAYVRSLRRAAQFPVSDRWLLRRTPISRGRALGALQWSIGGIALALIGMTVLLCYALWSGQVARVPAQCAVLAFDQRTDLVITARVTTSLARPVAPSVAEGKSV
jgi:hypothetical protein